MTTQDIEELSWRMGEVYEAVVNRILVNLARHFRYIEAGEIPSGAWEYQVKKLAEMGQINRETERHLQLRQEPQGSSDFRLRSQGPCRRVTGESGLVLG